MAALAKIDMRIDSALTRRFYQQYCVEASLRSVWEKFKAEEPEYLDNLGNSDISACGVDFDKPWDFFQTDGISFIEYLAAGITQVRDTYISDPHYGINIHKEERFGLAEFGTDSILCITVLVEPPD
ncbi:MAG: hypothetical protein AAFY17_14340 [Cyanobacteria bacterium J06642_11]